jgi:hypothetical protein
MYAEPHTSYQNVTIVGASPISEADLEWACGVTVLVLNSNNYFRESVVPSGAFFLPSLYKWGKMTSLYA